MAKCIPSRTRHLAPSQGLTHSSRQRQILPSGSPYTVASPQELEDFYIAVHGEDGNMPAFPSAYPQGALLGCVDVVDCVEVCRATTQTRSALSFMLINPAHAVLLTAIIRTAGCCRLGMGAAAVIGQAGAHQLPVWTLLVTGCMLRHEMLQRCAVWQLQSTPVQLCRKYRVRSAGSASAPSGWWCLRRSQGSGAFGGCPASRW